MDLIKPLSTPTNLVATVASCAAVLCRWGGRDNGGVRWCREGRRRECLSGGAGCAGGGDWAGSHPVSGR